MVQHIYSLRWEDLMFITSLTPTASQSTFLYFLSIFYRLNMLFQFSSTIVLLAAVVSACPSHEDLNIPRSSNELHKRAAAGATRDWLYTNSSHWGDIKPGESRASQPKVEWMTNKILKSTASARPAGSNLLLNFSPAMASPKHTHLPSSTTTATSKATFTIGVLDLLSLCTRTVASRICLP